MALEGQPKTLYDEPKIRAYYRGIISVGLGGLTGNLIFEQRVRAHYRGVISVAHRSSSRTNRKSLPLRGLTIQKPILADSLEDLADQMC